MSKIVEIMDVSLGYGHKTVLSDVNLAVHSGKRLGIIGPNGSGKTTLLRGLLGLIKPQKGTIRWREAPIPLRPGYVHQRQLMDELFPLTALEVVLMGRYKQIGLIKRPKQRDREAALEALEVAGLPDAAGALYRNLSGGQKQRVLIARALAGEPEFLVLDEPTADMDIAGEKAVMDLIENLHNQRGLPMVIVSHILNVVINHVDTVAIVRQGKVKVFDVEQLLDNRVLSNLYGIHLNVREVEGKRIVMPGD